MWRYHQEMMLLMVMITAMTVMRIVLYNIS